MPKPNRADTLATMVRMSQRQPGPVKQKKVKPTPEREAKGSFRSMGMARRLVPVIDTLRNQGMLSEAEWDALNYYRDQASLADKSPVRSCCDNSPRGGGGPGVTIISAMLETGRIERDLGQLVDIARAVAVDDVSLAQWCVEKHGGRERYGKKGQIIAIVPVREKHNIALARMELRMAAHRITR